MREMDPAGGEDRRLVGGRGRRRRPAIADPRGSSRRAVRAESSAQNDDVGERPHGAVQGRAVYNARRRRRRRHASCAAGRAGRLAPVAQRIVRMNLQSIVGRVGSLVALAAALAAGPVAAQAVSLAKGVATAMAYHKVKQGAVVLVSMLALVGAGACHPAGSVRRCGTGLSSAGVSRPLPPVELPGRLSARRDRCRGRARDLSGDRRRAW